MAHEARAFWVRSPGVGEIRSVTLAQPGPDEVLVRTRYSAISRGTETIVFRGQVPPSQYAVMRAPYQSGEFPGPVKYGYLNVGVVEEGPSALVGRTVFCLYPHQSAYVVPASAVVCVPDDVAPQRAVLAGTVETAVNALWDAAPLIGDRITVVGAGMVGCCVAAVLAKFPATKVQLVDVNPERAAIAAGLGVEFALPAQASRDRDLVIHASATSEGLALALELLVAEGTVIELSWHGDREVRLPLGGPFHSRRLRIQSSQVGTVAPARAATRGFSDRLAVAMDLLRDRAFEALLTGASPFRQLPELLGSMANGTHPALCQLITYGESDVWSESSMKRVQL